MKRPPSPASPDSADDQAESYVPPPINAPHLSTREMNLLEQAFHDRVKEARHLPHRLSRIRLWLVFLLVRHAALRLGEALGLDDERDIDLDMGMLRVSGAQARDVPLPASLVSELRGLFAQPLMVSRGKNLSRLDPGYVRRNFYARARECGLPPELASPRALRQSRAVELIQGGMPLPAVQKFLGQPSLESTGEFLAYTEADIRAMTRHYMHREAKLKTSARNVFPGRVDRVLRSGFLAEVRMTSFTGLQLAAIITGESLENLQLSEGRTVIATIKATWVGISRERSGAASARNRFPGRVSRVKRSEIVSEVEVDLVGGSTACALITTESADVLDLAPGEPVAVQFKAFAVVLAVP
jgi:molybdate transport system regulatory protein